MHKLIKNSVLLMLCQIGGMFIPLVELPILTRNLNPSEYGSLIYVISAALLASVFIEFGFTFSASRRIAEAENDKEIIGYICSDVLLAKMILSIISLVFLYVFIIFSNNIIIPFEWVILIFVMSISMGFSPIWYFIGIERLAIPAILDLSIRSIGLLSLYYFLPIYQAPETALIIMASVGFINTLIPSLIMMRNIHLKRFSISRAFLLLKESFHLFIFKSVSSVQQSIASLLLGRLGSSQMVGLFAPAEKLNRAVIGLMTPLVNVFFPFFIKTRMKDEKQFTTIFITFSILTFVALCIGSVVIYYFADLVMDLIFGNNYQSSILILQILVIGIPFKGLNIVLNIMWFVPYSKELLVNKILLGNLLLLLPLAYFIIPLYGSIGFAIGLVLIEILMTIILLICAYQISISKHKG